MLSFGNVSETQQRIQRRIIGVFVISVDSDGVSIDVSWYTRANLFELERSVSDDQSRAVRTRTYKIAVKGCTKEAKRRKDDDKIESSVKFRRKHVGSEFESPRKSLECSDEKEYFFESAASIGTRENAYPAVGNARAPLRPLSWQGSQLNDDWISQRRFSEFQRRRLQQLYGVS